MRDEERDVEHGQRIEEAVPVGEQKPAAPGHEAVADQGFVGMDAALRHCRRARGVEDGRDVTHPDARAPFRHGLRGGAVCQRAELRVCDRTVCRGPFSRLTEDDDNRPRAGKLAHDRQQPVGMIGRIRRRLPREDDPELGVGLYVSQFARAEAVVDRDHRRSEHGCAEQYLDELGAVRHVDADAATAPHAKRGQAAGGEHGPIEQLIERLPGTVDGQRRPAAVTVAGPHEQVGQGRHGQVFARGTHRHATVRAQW